MSYVDEIYNMVVEKNPAQPEFHQAVKEVMESLRVVIEANEAVYRRDAAAAGHGICPDGNVFAAEAVFG